MSCRAWLSILLIALIAGCGHDQLPTSGDVYVTPLFTSDTSGVTVRSTSSDILINIDGIPSDGLFFAIPLGAISVNNEQWTGDAKLLHLAIPHDGRLELGVYPLRGYAGNEVSAQITIRRDARQPSSPPIGTQNKVTDLTAEELGGGKYRLTWTEVNSGDYNIDGVVNLQDLVPLGRYFGLTQADPGWDVVRIADGDKNGQIGLSDLTQIGANYYSEVAGYVVKRGIPGTPPVWQLVTPEPLWRGDFLNPPYPPHYVFETDGAPEDSWSVAPVDRNGIEGVGSDNLALDRIDVSSSITYSGSDLWLLDGSAQGQLALGGYIMRVIDPIDIPTRTNPIGIPSDAALGEVQFNGLPRQTNLMLDNVIAPVIDPATGEYTPSTYRLITSVPFILPAAEEQLHISADIQLVQNLAGNPAYWIDSFVTQDLPGFTRHTRQDLFNNLVACDTTGDGGFGDEAWLYDSDNDGVSEALLRRLQLYDSYVANGAGQVQEVVLRAVVKSTSAMSFGILGLDMVFELVQTPTGPLYQPLDLSQLSFTEQTNFAELHLAGQPGEFESNFDPSTLTASDDLIVHGVRLVLNNPSPGQPPSYWADRILRKVN